MSRQVETQKIGMLPLNAFFIGTLVSVVAIMINAVYPYGGGWTDLSRAAGILMILSGMGIYAACFFILSLCVYWCYRGQEQVNLLPVKWAIGLHGLYLACLGILMLTA